MDVLPYRIYYRRNLPHFQPPGATIFITFRLNGSLPKRIIKQLLEENGIIEFIGSISVNDDGNLNIIVSGSNVNIDFAVPVTADDLIGIIFTSVFEDKDILEQLIEYQNAFQKYADKFKDAISKR